MNKMPVIAHTNIKNRVDYLLRLFKLKEDIIAFKTIPLSHGCGM